MCTREVLILIWLVTGAIQALDLFGRVGELAEQEKHHPDLHLEVRALFSLTS